MSTITRLISAEELLHMPEDEGRWCELVNGELVPMSPPGAMHGLVCQTVSGLLLDYVSSRMLGRIFAAETGFVVSRNPDTVMAPDGAFVRESRIKALGVPRTYFPEAPALAFEVVSPGDTVSEVALKMRRWLAAGVELAWVIDPEARTVTVYKSPHDIAVLTEQDALTGGEVVPGFECRVADLFAGLA
ncbi:MAG: Uma2 family endonuclease [Pirellulales bacterium]|nr:Uma2 family endonuclease [Pirellulales bacterium]